MTTEFLVELGTGFENANVYFQHLPDGWDKTLILLKHPETGVDVGSCNIELLPGCCGVVVLSYPKGLCRTRSFIDTAIQAGKSSGYTAWMVTMVEPDLVAFFKDCGFKPVYRFQNFFHTPHGGNHVTVLVRTAFAREQRAAAGRIHKWDRNLGPDQVRGLMAQGD